MLERQNSHRAVEKRTKMWIWTRGGFKSAVEYDPKKDKRKDSPFLKIAKKKGTHALVRARVHEHLEDLKTVCPNVLIERDDSADYMFRAVIPRKAWEKYLVNEARAMDYDSHFKEVVREAQPAHLKQPVYNAMMATWSNNFDLQPASKYGYYGTGAYGSKATKGRSIVTVADVDEWVGDGDAWLDQGGDADDDEGAVQWIPPEERLYLADVIALLKKRGTVSFSADEVERFTDTAFEFYTVLDADYGADTKITEEEIYEARDFVLKLTRDFYNQATSVNVIEVDEGGKA